MSDIFPVNTNRGINQVIFDKIDKQFENTVPIKNNNRKNNRALSKRIFFRHCISANCTHLVQRFHDVKLLKTKKTFYPFQMFLMLCHSRS